MKPSKHIGPAPAPAGKAGLAGKPNVTTPVVEQILAGTTSAGRGEGDAVPERWRWHYRTLLQLRDRLRSERGLRQASANGLLEPHSLSEADSASDEFDRALALGGLSVTQDTLLEVNEALGRIRSGRYGECEVSGQPIPEERLRAIPWTRYTCAVEQRLEEAGVRPGAGVGAVHSVRRGGQVRMVGAVTGMAPGDEPDAAVLAANDEALEAVPLPPPNGPRDESAPSSP
jgi:RNA polymerase-binding transcription factor DksA